MVEILQAFRPVISQEQDGFGAILAQVLSPARPLQSERFLRGREAQLNAIKRALHQQGRHILIHGFRGVGKSSLARTVAFGLAKEREPIVVGCDSNSTFRNIVREIFDEAANRDPSVEKKIRELGGGFEKFGITVNGRVTLESGRVAEAVSVNEAVRVMKFICDTYAPQPVIIIDEFDQVTSKEEQILFTNFIKQVSDKHVPARFLFCGIGDNVDDIMAAHGSADRYFHTEALGPLPWEARYEVVEYAADQLGIEIDTNTVIRIARISDGFPYYVHFISEKLFWRVFEAKNGGKVTGELFELAMADAAQSMEMRLRGPYEAATQKYRNDYEPVLWAAADGHEFRKPSSAIYDSYARIVEQLREEPQREKFNQRINALKKKSHGRILTGSRQGWYEFTEKMIRGYVRLKAEQRGVVLEVDHPAVARRFRT